MRGGRLSELSDDELSAEVESLGISLDCDDCGRDVALLGEVLHSVATDYEPLLTERRG